MALSISDRVKALLNRFRIPGKRAQLGTIIQNLQQGDGIDLARGSILVGDSSGVSSALSAKGDGKILIGDGTDLASVSVSGDIAITNAGVASIAADSIVNADINSAAAIAYSKLSLASSVQTSDLASGFIYGIAADDAKTTSRDENVAGLSSAITLANELKADMNSHAADALEHTTAIDNVNYPIAEADASDLASLITLVTAELTAYDAHDADAEAGTPSYHAATEAGDHSLASAVAPTTLNECITRLNDLKAKYNAHDADSTAHGVGSNYQIAAADAALGAAILVSESGVASGDLVSWSILDSGTGTVTGVSAVATTNGITFTFSADPQDDCIISYMVLRSA